MSATPRLVLLTGTKAFDNQFEAIAEARHLRVALAEAIRFDDAEQHYVVRLFSQILTLPEEYRDPLLVTFLARETRDQAQRRATERAQRDAGLVTKFLRTANGLLDRALEGLRSLQDVGKWRRPA